MSTKNYKNKNHRTARSNQILIEVESADREGAASAICRVDDRTSAVVRVARGDGKDIPQDELVSVDSDLPSDVRFASYAVYPEPDGDLQKVWAKKIQNEAEDDDRVLYNVVVESDGLEDVDISNDMEFWRVIGWVMRFVEQRLGIERDEYTLSYSGNRSIHVETTRFVRDKHLNKLRDEVREFNQETGADLDSQIYKQKPQWRLPYATHRTGLKKIPISPDDSFKQVFRRAARCDESPTLPETIASSPVVGNLSEVLDGEADELIDEYLLWEPTTDGEKVDDKPEAEYCPHLGARGGDKTESIARSVAVIEQLDNEPIVRDGKHLLRVHIRHAIGANGDYRVDDRICLMRLSEQDKEKWRWKQGDELVVIGGRSWNCRVIDITGSKDLVRELTGKLSIDGRKLVLKELGNYGFDVGDAGYHGDHPEEDNQAGNQVTPAQRIKRQIDTGKLEVEHDAAFRVSCRLLEIRGWDAAWEWCREAFGDDFDPEVTYETLRHDIVEQYGDLDVEVPDRQRVLGK